MKHPEAVGDEIVLTNGHKGEYTRYVGYKYKREGKTAYSKSGEIVSGLVPIFVNREEVKKRMMNTTIHGAKEYMQRILDENE